MNRNRCGLKFLICCSATLVLTTLGKAVDAAIVPLRGIADGSSSYTEEFSASFFQIDLRDPPPNESKQRFRLLSDPSIAVGNPDFDGFPNDDMFQLGYFGYDETGLVNNSGTIAIDELVFSVTRDPLDSSHVNYGRWTGVQTRDIVIDPSSTVTFDNGIVTDIDLQSTMAVEIFQGVFFRRLPGFFNVAGDRFEGNFASNAPSDRIIYDFSGTLTLPTAIPEPSMLSALFLLTGVGCLVRRRCRSFG
ncbi:MAG: PEP-CTERM sorting domain-containing protein [Planctomycetota bacterium]